MNARLCTVEEILKLGKATGTGCNNGKRYKFDDEYLWTSHVVTEMGDRNEIEYGKRKERMDIVNRTEMARKNKTAMDAIVKEMANKELPPKSAHSLAGNPKIQKGYWLKKHPVEVTPIETKLPVR